MGSGGTRRRLVWSERCYGVLRRSSRRSCLYVRLLLEEPVSAPSSGLTLIRGGMGTGGSVVVAVVAFGGPGVPGAVGGRAAGAAPCPSRGTGGERPVGELDDRVRPRG